ncbi:PilZ domain-containing protein [Desulfomonile tiedjei]|uniref:PilZ domain-containing protein n=1 Tax=Desulfomonile tiedjei (strain ATCC 49306 / DSM 6799 / DCB-1) TaxID=706587 RepID=I4C8P1_DESTA|nr:PilZ domain-containing protein [Desulfomonile tiedjei]AFM25932.1 hypothetical protein Desti_3274 [Desulfomonile tiedjei DSM 6799]
MTEKPRINARDAVIDIRSGASDAELMEKYGLCAKGLQSLFRKLIEVRAITREELDRRRTTLHKTAHVTPIVGTDLTKDIRAGMSDAELMQKYGLSSEGLRFTLQALIDTQVISLDELYNTTPSQADTVFVNNMRESPRYFFAVVVEIYEAKRPHLRGNLSNITEKGIATEGIETREGETKVLVIPTDRFPEIDRIVLEAECRWVKQDENTGEWAAGFEITKISDECLDNLAKLMSVACFLE